MSNFRILALDGGGLQTAFSVSALVRLEALCENRRILDSFDLIVGTSTGGIVAIALAMGVPTEEILQFCCGIGRSIFGKNGRGESWVKSRSTVFQPKMSRLRKLVLV